MVSFPTAPSLPLCITYLFASHCPIGSPAKPLPIHTVGWANACLSFPQLTTFWYTYRTRLSAVLSGFEQHTEYVSSECWSRFTDAAVPMDFVGGGRAAPQKRNVESWAKKNCAKTLTNQRRPCCSLELRNTSPQMERSKQIRNSLTDAHCHCQHLVPQREFTSSTSPFSRARRHR